jgi:hypothetical protein
VEQGRLRGIITIRAGAELVELSMQLDFCCLREFIHLRLEEGGVKDKKGAILRLLRVNLAGIPSWAMGAVVQGYMAVVVLMIGVVQVEAHMFTQMEVMKIKALKMVCFHLAE